MGEIKINNTFTKSTPLTSSVVSPLKHSIFSNLSTLPTTNEDKEILVVAKGDGAASYHYWKVEDKR